MIKIKEYDPKYRDDIIQICWKTGYMGDDAAPFFNDRYLFGLLFCLYYTDYEPENCFIAVCTKSDKAVGYILSSLNSELQELRFKKRIVPRIIIRLFVFSIWRYHKSFRLVLGWRRQTEESEIDTQTLYLNYPAHLHIDVLEKFQRQGIGTKLVMQLEHYLKFKGIKGVHLGTSSYNSQALTFYKKMGYKIIYEGSEGSGMWPEAREARSIIFAKEL